MHKSLHLVNSIVPFASSERIPLWSLIARTTLWQSEREMIPWQPLNGNELKVLGMVKGHETFSPCRHEFAAFKNFTWKKNMYGFFFLETFWSVSTFLHVGFFLGVSAQQSYLPFFPLAGAKIVSRWNGWNVMRSEPSWRRNVGYQLLVAKNRFS